MTGTDLALTLILGLLIVIALLVAIYVIDQSAVRGEAAPNRATDPLDLRRAERIYVTLNDDQTFVGDLTETGDHTIALRNAAAIGNDGNRPPVDGTLLIPRDKVAYIQAPRSSTS